MADRTSKIEENILSGFTHTLEGGLFMMEIGAMVQDQALAAVETYKTALKNPEMKKSLFIIRKEAKPMGAPARVFIKGMEACDDKHILASALVFPSISVMHLAKMMTPVDETDIQFFMDRKKAVAWLEAWESKTQSKEWLKAHKE